MRELLPLKNDAWRDEDEPRLSPAQFAARITLQSVNAYGSFGFWHDDGDLFWGHSVQVTGNLKEGPKDADIPG